jgi:serine/threonine-protein kinase RsbW
VSEAQRRLASALAEQSRLTARYKQSVGTTAELSAYASLRAATSAVAECERLVDEEVTGTEPRAPLNGDGDAARAQTRDRFVFSVVRDRTAPGAARDEVDRRLRGLVDDAAMDSIRLLVSETVTNAVTHGGNSATGTVAVEGDLSADRLWLGVTNAGPAFVHVPALPAPSAPHGRGLFLVECLSRAWGTGHAGGSTSVWFEVDRRAPAAS